MYHKIKNKDKVFKYTDLLGILFLIHPVCILFFNYPPNLFFYIGILCSIFFISLNLFGYRGYYIVANNNMITFNDTFIPAKVKIKDIIEIEKNSNSIVFKTSDKKTYVVDFNKIPKKEKYKTNDLYYDIHNIVQRNTLKV